VCRKELYARAQLENDLFAAEMQEFCAAHEQKCEDEREEQVASGDNHGEEEDYGSGNSEEGGFQIYGNLANWVDTQDEVWSEGSDSSGEDDEVVDPDDESYTADMGLLKLKVLYN
jgi:hypothetical protein